MTCGAPLTKLGLELLVNPRTRIQWQIVGAVAQLLEQKGQLLEELVWALILPMGKLRQREAPSQQLGLLGLSQA